MLTLVSISGYANNPLCVKDHVPKYDEEGRHIDSKVRGLCVKNIIEKEDRVVLENIYYHGGSRLWKLDEGDYLDDGVVRIRKKAMKDRICHDLGFGNYIKGSVVTGKSNNIVKGLYEKYSQDRGMIGSPSKEWKIIKSLECAI